MTRPVVLDTSVLLRFHDPDHADHSSASSQIHACASVGTVLIVPATVLAEVLSIAQQSGPHALRVVDGFARSVITRVHPIDSATARAAARYRGLHPELDAAASYVLATAEVTDASYVLSARTIWRHRTPAVVRLIPPTNDLAPTAAGEHLP